MKELKTSLTLNFIKKLNKYGRLEQEAKEKRPK